MHLEMRQEGSIVPAIVQLDDDMMRTAIDMANVTYELFSDHQGHYDNTLNAHMVGKVGELACAQWAANLAVFCDQAFRDISRTNDADLILNLADGRKLRIEVKTWSSNLWQPFGRCIPAGQMAQVSAKADIVLWCKTTPLSDVSLGHKCEVEIAGWNRSADIAQIPPIYTGPTGRRQVLNHQVPMDLMRLLGELKAIIRPLAR